MKFVDFCNRFNYTYPYIILKFCSLYLKITCFSSFAYTSSFLWISAVNRVSISSCKTARNFLTVLNIFFYHFTPPPPPKFIFMVVLVNAVKTQLTAETKTKPKKKLKVHVQELTRVLDIET